MNNEIMNQDNNKILIYTSDDGQVKIEVRLEDENVWLTQNAMAELFNTTKQNISLHIKNIFEEKELDENSVVKENLTTASDGKNYKTKFYNLDLIISVGYRVKSIRGTQFRIWANKLIKEYLIKGYNLNVDRFKNNGGGVYFEEVLEKIRDIRSSEKVFWRKILDIYATSIDYDAKDEKTKEFFKTVQNKMHYAVHGNTAAEVIFNRVDSEKENIGLTNFKGNMPTKFETEIAKNYLSEKEIDMLNRMVSAYLDVAEINALNMHPMTMKDWIKELDGFLTMTHKEILEGAGLDVSEQISNYDHIISEKKVQLLENKITEKKIRLGWEVSNLELRPHRKGNEKEMKFIYDLKKEVYQKYVEKIYGEWNEENQQKLFDRFMKENSKNIWLIYLKDNAVGFYNGKDKDNNIFEIGNICVKPEYQNKGIGTAV